MHLQRAVTKTQLSTTTPWQPPQSDPRNDEAVNIMLERILKNTPVTVPDALILSKKDSLNRRSSVMVTIGLGNGTNVLQ
jgi:hypothetical protein